MQQGYKMKNPIVSEIGQDQETDRYRQGGKKVFQEVQEKSSMMNIFPQQQNM